ncbi:MAG TPA: hypothetical protein VK646_03250 [Actinomycetota bacterium]|nr:hypothetical protein [Actinomycetota bacterium]
MPETAPNEPARSNSRDHSTLRARLADRKLENRSVEAELRSVIFEREAAENEPKPERD